MGHFRFALVLFLAIPVYAKVPSVTLSESYLSNYVAQKENVSADEIRRIVLKKDKAFKDGVILLNSISGCGVGTCSYYAFVKNERGSFDFAGQIEGLFQSTNEIKNSNLPEIVTQAKAGTEVSEKTNWRYNKTSKVYEAQ